jgi:hypothetical protein
MPFANMARRSYRGFKMNYPWANVGMYEGGMVIANLNNRINALQKEINQLENTTGGNTLVKAINLTNTFEPNILSSELTQYNNITVIPTLSSTKFNYPSRAPNTVYQLRRSMVVDEYNHRWSPFLPRVFSINASSEPEWQDGLDKKYVKVGNQYLSYLATLKGPWTPNTEYNVGDHVYIQSGYPDFMGMPAGQMQTFVFTCVQNHTSDTDRSIFFDTNNDYFYYDNNENQIYVFPVREVNLEGTVWRLCEMNYVRQFSFWNKNTHSVSATLFTDAMQELHYPTHDNTSDNYLMSTNNNDNIPYSLNQQQGVIVEINGQLTLWQSNWWKVQNVQSGSGSITFPESINYNDKHFVIDNNFLWRYDDNGGYEDYVNASLPANMDIKPSAKVTFLATTNMHNNINGLRFVNMGANQDDTSSSLDDEPNEEALILVFDHIRCEWLEENN